MSTWFLPTPLNDVLYADAQRDGELSLPSEGLADLSRTQGVDQIAEWLRALHPEATPEYIALMAHHFWRLGHELLPEDTIVVPAKNGNVYMVGEITEPYRREARASGMCHIWPVAWRETGAPKAKLATFSVYDGNTVLTEVTDEHALQSLTQYMPSKSQGNARIFRWIAITTLIFELVYFWPHS